MFCKLGNVLAAASLLAATATAGSDKSMTGCLEVHVLSSNLVRAPVLLMAEQTSYLLFREIGISVRWKHSDLRKADKSCMALLMQFDWDAAAKLNAMGYSYPYASERTPIHVLISRIAQGVDERQRGMILGYVMAHEIGHMLKKLDRHSKTRIMKPVWTMADYLAIYGRSLRFDNEESS